MIRFLLLAWVLASTAVAASVTVGSAETQNMNPFCAS